MQAIIWFIAVVVAIIQIVMIVKFFGMASDLKELKDFIIKNGGLGNPTTRSSDDIKITQTTEQQGMATSNSVLKWGLIAAIIVILCLLVLYYSYVYFGFKLI